MNKLALSEVHYVCEFLSFDSRSEKGPLMTTRNICQNPKNMSE